MAHITKEEIINYIQKEFMSYAEVSDFFADFEVNIQDALTVMENSIEDMLHQKENFTAGDGSFLKESLQEASEYIAENIVDLYWSDKNVLDAVNKGHLETALRYLMQNIEKGELSIFLLRDGKLDDPNAAYRRVINFVIYDIVEASAGSAIETFLDDFETIIKQKENDEYRKQIRSFMSP